MIVIGIAKGIAALIAVAIIVRTLRLNLADAGRRVLIQQPDAVALSLLPGYKWRDAAIVEWLVAPLREKGFVDLGAYEVKPMRGYRIGVLLNERENVAAFINEQPRGTTLELSVRYADGTTTALVNHPDSGVPRPPFFRMIFADPSTPSGELYERLLRERPAFGIKTITAGNVIEEFEAAYKKLIAYIKNRGFSAGEVSAIAARANQPLTMTTRPLEQKQAETPKPRETPAGAVPGPVVCPNCSQVNEAGRDVCWACSNLLSGDKKPVHESAAYLESAQGAVPEPIRGQLEPGERVLWHGKPSGNLPVVERIKWLGACSLGLVMSGAAAIALRALLQAAWTHDQSLVALCLGLVLSIWIGFWLHAGLYYNPWVIANTVYAVTDRRVIMVFDWPLRRVTALDLDRLYGAYVVGEPFGGPGTIEFRRKGWVGPVFTIRGAQYPELYFVDDVLDVQAVIAQAQAVAAARPASEPRSGDAPASLQTIIGPLCWAALALSALLLLADVSAIIQSGGKILAQWDDAQDKRSLPHVWVLLAAPVMMYFLYARAKLFNAGSRVARTGDVAGIAGLVVLGGLLLFLGNVSLSKTFFYALAGIFILPGTSGRESGAP